MYLVTYAHGSYTVERGHRETIEQKYAACAQDMREREARIVMYIPKRIEWECTVHAGIYTVYGIPCHAVSMQNVSPNGMPKGWESFWTEHATK